MIRIKNDSGLRVIFSIFNQGDNGIPFDHAWVEGGGNYADLNTGTFKIVSIGVQSQEGGRWIGKDPKDWEFVVSVADKDFKTLRFTATLEEM
jgi:hypothetical protein